MAMNNTVGVINPNSREVHQIPFEDLGAAMEAGGQFASEEDKQKANSLQAMQDKQSYLPETPFNNREEQGNPEPAQAQSQAPEPEPESNIFTAVATDAIKSLRDSLASGISFVGRIPDDLRGIGEEFKKDPIGEFNHAVERTGVGLANSAKEFANLGLSVLDDPVARSISGGKFGKPRIGETGLEKALNLKGDKKGDELFEHAGDLAAVGTGIAGAFKGLSKFLSKTLPIGSEKLLRNKMTEDIITAAKEHGASEKEVKQLQDSLALEFSKKHGLDIGDLSPRGHQVKANIKRKKIEELRPTAEIPEREVPNKVEPPSKEDIVGKAEVARNEASDALSQALKIREEHPLKAGQIIQKHIKKLHKAATDLYTKVEKGYKGIEIPVDNTAKINETAGQLHKLIEEDLASGDSLAPGYGSGTSEQKALEDKIKSLERETVSASDVYDVQRTLQNRAQKARDASFASGLDKIERTRLQKLAARHESAAAKLGNVLEKVGDPNTQAMIKEANSTWKAYKDIGRSKVGKYIIRNEGKIPADTMFKITGTGKGNEHLRRLVESDPELSDYILGQKYAKPSQHKELLEGNETVDAYIKRSPLIQDKMTKLKVALKDVAEGNKNYKQATSEYKALEKSIREAAKEQLERKKAKAQIDKLTSERQDHLKASDILGKKIKEAEKKGENTAKLKEEFERHKREYNDKGTRLDKLKKLAWKYGTAKVGYETIVNPNKSSH